MKAIIYFAIFLFLKQYNIKDHGQVINSYNLNTNLNSHKLIITQSHINILLMNTSQGLGTSKQGALSARSELIR